MPSSLIPEKPLVFSPELAATIGLEEAILLQVLHDVTHYGTPDWRRGYRWLRVPGQRLLDWLPFWDTRALRRVIQSLRDQGVILLEDSPFNPQTDFVYALNESLPEPTPAPMPTPAASHGATSIAPEWQPDDDTLRQLALQGVPTDFAQRLVPEFITYWRDRGTVTHSWDAKFLRHALRQWRHEETHFPAAPPETDQPMTPDWRPSAEVYDILGRGGIPRSFVEEAIPEFTLYWGDRGTRSRTWNSTFVQHVRKQWLHHTHSLENDTQPRPIPADWQPGQDVFDILAMAHIDADFARGLVDEFVLYWRDSNQLHRSWNSKFLQHVKHRWARQQQSDRNYAEQFFDTFTDTSWADQL